MTADAVVIGAGPNGLVAANMLAERGWDVLVCEEQDVIGGAVRTTELTLPGFHHDEFSSFYPLAIASPAMQAMELERWGVRWRRSTNAVAHPARDGSCSVIGPDQASTASSLEGLSPGDGRAWEELYALWEDASAGVVGSLLGAPFPPVRAGLELLRSLGTRDLLRFARLSLLPVRRLADERFSGEGARRLLAGNALHADFTPESAGSGIFGLVLCGLGQQHGFPTPEGGAAAVPRALARRLEAHGGRVQAGAWVERIEVGAEGVRGVRLAGGERVAARKAVLADVGAPQLYRDLIEPARLPPRLLRDLEAFEYDAGTVKVDWALDAPIPWASEAARQAGTVHVGDTVDDLSRHAASIAAGRIPDRPCLVIGQYACLDETRAPEGRDTAWAYAHVPQTTRGDGRGELVGRWDEEEGLSYANRIEEEVEALAPGFRDLIAARHVHTPRTMEAANRNLVGGAVNGGTAQIHQQTLFRPVPGLARPETPVAGLYLCSASAHPGGGVHGAAGAGAARAALRPWTPLSRLARMVLR